NETTTATGTSGLSSTSYNQNFTFTESSGAIGHYFSANPGTGPQLPQITASRPVEPRADFDVTAAAPDNSLLPAHGAIVSGLQTDRVVTPFDAAFSRPTLDNAAGEPEAVNSVAAFPTRLAGVTTASDTQGLVGPDGIAQRQKLVLIPGQFISTRPDDPTGTGAQVLFKNMSGDVYYSDSTDWTAPKVGDVVLRRSSGEAFANVSVVAGDASNIHRVVALWQAGTQDWQSLDLGVGGGAFTGSLPVPTSVTNEQIRVVVQVVDGAGNVSWAANKGPGFSPTPPPPPAPAVTLSPVPPASGWYTSSPLITVSGSPSATFTTSIDGAASVPYAGPFTPIGLTNGSHVIAVTGSDGSAASVTVRLDTTPPQITATMLPAANAAGWRNSTVTATFTCTDSGSGVDVCPVPVSTGLLQGDNLVLTGTGTDKAGLSTTVTQTVKVDTAAPTVPVVALDPAARPQDQSTSITATSIDALSGLAGGEWWIGIDPGVGNGTPLVVTAGSLTGSIPSTLSPGDYTVSVRALDLAGNWSVAGTAALTVFGPVANTAPTATPQNITTPEDATLPIVLGATDPNSTDTLTFAVVSQPTHGALTGPIPNLIYTPEANYNGTDSFTFKANDGTADSAAATINITITPVNDPPVAAPVSVSTNRDTSAIVQLSATDVDGDALTFVIVDQPLHGALSGSGSTRTYTPATGYAGPDSFTYKASDGLVDSNLATVSITVVATNRPPTATAASVSTNEDTAVVANLTGNDPDSDTLTFTIASQPAHGTLTGSGAARTYAPAANYNGPDSFTFTASDASSTSAPATISITVLPVNDAPVANPVTVASITAQATPVVLSGSDVDGDPLTFIVITPP
ncbi:MAG: Ig-like domain-containing protein, partial [Ilumatobacteraceae bacterium]